MNDWWGRHEKQIGYAAFAVLILVIMAVVLWA
jgi:hypothetical protein